MRIGVLTGGGDVPGLNPAIRAVARRAFEYDYEVMGIKDGYRGLIEGDIEPLILQSVSGILHVGGTILGTSRTNPLKREGDMDRCLENIKGFGLDALVVIGGDDTQGLAYEFDKRGVSVVGIPKTMDNDVAETDYCIGFNTAVTIVADALDRLHTTGNSHHRVMVLEVMGRHAGWVATIGGLGGGADFIAIPEVSLSLDEVCKHVEKRWEEGKRFSVIVVSEGAQFEEIVYKEEELGKQDEFGHVMLIKRGLGATVAEQIQRRTGKTSRAVVLGHLQRGGSPTVFDRVMALRMGVRAVDLIKEGKFGYMVALKGSDLISVELAKVAGRTRSVDLDLYRIAQVFY